MKWYFLLFLIAQVTLASGQRFQDPELQSLVEAEEAFIQMAKEKNTRDAFLFFLANDAVTAAQGHGPRIGKKHLEQQTPNDSWLSWKPVFSDIAASGDFGYNIGPWEFRPMRTDKDAVAYGHFVSLWKKDEHGDWKVAVDIGISHGKPTPINNLKTSAIRREKEKQPVGVNVQALFDLEKRFVVDLNQRGHYAYKDFISPEIKFLRPGHEPYVTAEDVQQVIGHPSQKTTSTFVGGDMASSGDLACVYGKTSIERTINSSQQTSHHTYLRFWKKENGKWKIVVDVLSD